MLISPSFPYLKCYSKTHSLQLKLLPILYKLLIKEYYLFQKVLIFIYILFLFIFKCCNIKNDFRILILHINPKLIAKNVRVNFFIILISLNFLNLKVY